MKNLEHCRDSGQNGTEFHPGQPGSCNHHLKVINNRDRTYYKLLQKKLQFAASRFFANNLSQFPYSNSLYEFIAIRGSY